MIVGALELLGDGEIGAVAHELLIDPLALGRPDMLLQPGHQGQVIGHAAEQRHRRVTVGIDQPGAEQHVRQFAGLRGGVLESLFAWANKHNAPVANANAVILEYDTGRFNRHQPGGQQQ